MSEFLQKVSAAHLPALLMLILLALFPARLSAEVGDIIKYTYQGQPIKYIILSEDEKTVATNPGNYGKAGNEVLGALVLPSKVVNGDTEYTLLEISDYSFYANYDLTSITIPESVTSIGKYAFNWCMGLVSLHLPETLTTIGDSAFNWCMNLVSVHFPESLTTIGERAFFACSDLEEVIIPNSVTSIGSAAFNGCDGLRSATLSSSLTSISEKLFSECKALASVTIPEGVTEIGDRAFYGCEKLSSVTLPNSLVSIGYQTFSDAGITSIIIPDAVTSIDDSAFSSCNSLTSVTIGKSVTEIAYGAFGYCKNLKNVYSWAINPPTLERDVFQRSYPNYATLHVPAESVAAYSKAEQWEDFGEILGDVESAGIEDVEVDGNNAPAEYFNLNGVRVDNPENGLYIKRQGGKATKVLVK
ncbi:MAG: leucine-rich repeat domain-containing protein [[Clostridium] fimetarium]|nr:leucine-rich repeat domain-containing protein [Alistipes timonensis]MCM1405122.1 leucine-rich repeat domain-containing protein [[Clostridium] fimetarium]